MPSLMFVCRDILRNEIYKEEKKKESVSLLNFKIKNESLTESALIHQDFPHFPYKKDI
jgi:hypothetical protein